MVALIPTDEDATRLAVHGGEPADQLHVTLTYLGEAADLDQVVRDAIVNVVESWAAKIGPVEADGFALSLFNPGDGERDTCITLGLSGDVIADVHRDIATWVEDAVVSVGAEIPEQHRPWVAHLTLVYTEDVGLLEKLVDRVGPVMFDRIRVAFGDVHTDVPLVGDGLPAALAKAFADVVQNGSKASQLSHDIYDMVTRGAEPTNRATIIFLQRPSSILDRTYKRDERGRFGSGSGIRSSLADAKTLDEVNSAAADEARRITGRTGGDAITFTMRGSDPEVAKQHAEGVLRGLEEFPKAPLRNVTDFDPDNPGMVHYGAMADSIAFSSMGFTRGYISFNVRYSGDPAKYERALHSSHGFLTDPTMIGVAQHEFGHILTSRHGETGTPPKVPAKKIATEMAREQPGRGVRSYVSEQLSGYATTTSHELNAEAFADVMAHGDGAAPVSQAIYGEIQALYP